MKKKVTLTLDDVNFQRLRIRALKEGTSASAIIDKLIAQYLRTARKAGKR